MRWKIATILLSAFILWTWVIPQARWIYDVFFTMASSRVCWYDSDGDGYEDTGYIGYPAFKGFDWSQGTFIMGTNCPPHER